MAKEEAKAAAPKSGVGTRTWRGKDVFFCQAPGCVFDHESKAVVQRHVKLGKHRVQGKPDAKASEGGDVSGEV